MTANRRNEGTAAQMLPCTCHSDELEPYCPRHTPLPGEDDQPGREPGEVDLSKTHECPICGKRFWAMLDISDHIGRRHRGS